MRELDYIHVISGIKSVDFISSKKNLPFFRFKNEAIPFFEAYCSVNKFGRQTLIGRQNFQQSHIILSSRNKVSNDSLAGELLDRKLVIRQKMGVVLMESDVGRIPHHDWLI